MKMNNAMTTQYLEHPFPDVLAMAFGPIKIIGLCLKNGADIKRLESVTLNPGTTGGVAMLSYIPD